MKPILCFGDKCNDEMVSMLHCCADGHVLVTRRRFLLFWDCCLWATRLAVVCSPPSSAVLCLALKLWFESLSFLSSCPSFSLDCIVLSLLVDSLLSLSSSPSFCLVSLSLSVASSKVFLLSPLLPHSVLFISLSVASSKVFFLSSLLPHSVLFLSLSPFNWINTDYPLVLAEASLGFLIFFLLTRIPLLYTTSNNKQITL